MTTEDVRARLLAHCDAAYQRALPRSARGVRRGILSAQQLISDLDPDHDTFRWLAHLLEELALLRARVTDDPDGFELGGIATVRLLVEEQRIWLGYIPADEES
jgi:hypothetical protein